MRHVRIAAVGAAGVVLLLAGCSSSSKPAAAPSGTAPAATSSASTSAASPAPATHPGLGVSQTLKFSGGTATMTVLKLVDPAKPTQGAEKTGFRDVAVQIKITGNGPAAFTSGTMITLLAFDADGQNLEKHIYWSTSAGPELDALAGVTVAPGDTRSGFVTFMVPTGAKLARLQYTPPGGSAVEWTVG